LTRFPFPLSKPRLKTAAPDIQYVRGDLMSALRQKKKLNKKDIYPLAVAILSFLLAVAVMRLLFLRFLPDNSAQRRNADAAQSASSQTDDYEYFPTDGR